MTGKGDVLLAFDQIATRLDNHGMEIHALGEKMDKKFDQLFSAFSQFKKESIDTAHAIDARVIKLESERGTLGKIFTVMFGAISGLLGGWFGNKL